MESTYKLKDLLLYFLRLGTWGFGGPVALVGYMHRDLVERKRWFDEDQYREGLTLAQLAPGPLAAQLGIYFGYVHFGAVGAGLCGLAFVLPSFLMVLALGRAYLAFGGLPWMQSVFYGVGSAVIGIIVLSCYRLTRKTVGTSLREDPLRWVLFGGSAAVTVWREREEMLLFLAAGLVYMLVRTRPVKGMALTLWLGFLPAFQPDGRLWQIGWFFTKAGAFVFGSGLAIIPFLQTGVVHEMGWLTQQQFLDAVAVAMITPGPVVITVGFIGYLVEGTPGAVVAALGVFLPCYVFTVVPAPYFRKISGNRYIRAFVDGLTAAVVGALAGSVIVIALRTFTDALSPFFALATLICLIRFKKIPEPVLILAAGVLGYTVRFFF